MKRTEICELTMLCLVHQGGKVLLQNRVKKDWQGYTLPGGHIEPGESIVDACIREMREETGLKVWDLHLCGIKQFPIPQGRYLVFLFETEHFSGELRSSPEGSMEWVELDRIGEFPTVSDLKELLEVMYSPKLNEFQYVTDGGNWIVNLR